MSELATRSPQQELVAQIRTPQFREQVKLALPSDVSPDRFVRATLTALMQNDELAKAEPQSLFQSVIRCAQDGLLPDGREAALVMFYDKKQGVHRAQYLPMVGGYRKIAGEHGWAIRSAVVYEHDEFDYELGLDARLLHRPPRPGRERGQMIAAYAVGAHKDGRKEFEVMDGAEIEKVRHASRSGDRGPWVDWTERMWEKTAARRLFKKLPLGGRDERVERVLAADELDPAAAAEELYGPGGSRFRSTPAPPPVDGASPGLTAGADRKAEDAVPPLTAASSAPDFTEGDPEPDPEARALADSAGQQQIPARSKPFGGRTIADVHAEEGDEALRFFAFALEPARAWSKPNHADHLFAEALRLYCAAYLPELLGDAKAAA